MRSKRLRAVAGAVFVATAASVQTVAGTPAAAADPCPDVEVIWARGTGAPAGLGWLGTAFVDSLRAKVGGRSVGAYGVNYPASFDFDASAPMGAADAAGRVQWMADNCPDTRLVLGGNSQGAGVIDLITLDATPRGRFTPTPLAPHLSDRVAAVAVFGNPLRDLPGGGPLSQVSGVFGSRSIDLCGLDDPFCSSGLNFPAHFSYIKNGMVEEATNFVAGRLQ
ncbi:cutinase family protein [Mycolicibacterium sp. PAM1]|uniref:Cutinase n=1 Tax=Mycolicibacterium gilvum (strain PYR-GCK) TaxID=350054 RepID=A4TAB3_MYCGI|nr:cutinase family protein [Mycolicibacterium sp. PAM1]ABP45849.1 Cutinase [Mycolicibacterium gilvum PYR-GCK]MBV5243536.1 cutinase family protein [Mycolicibacterium sp. PAM1]